MSTTIVSVGANTRHTLCSWPMDQELLRHQVAAYVRAYIRAQRKAEIAYRDIARELRCSHVQVQKIEKRRGGVGRDTERVFAELRHGGSVDALRAAAVRHWEEHPDERTPAILMDSEKSSTESVTVRWGQSGDPCPSRNTAIELMRGCVDEQVLEAVQTEQCPENADPGVEYWTTRIVELQGMRKAAGQKLDRTSETPTEPPRSTTNTRKRRAS